MNRLREHWQGPHHRAAGRHCDDLARLRSHFDSKDFWFHTSQADFWVEIWDAWHIERVLTGKTALYYTDSLYHPQGLSLVWQVASYPHALMLIALKAFMPIDSAYNLLFLLILCFNAGCAYVLILHLLKDKWIALFGALVVAASAPFLGHNTIPDLIMIGTLPLTVYFFLRQVAEDRWIFAALAGACAGASVFISVYIFFIILMTIGILAICLAAAHWKRPAFWRGLLLLLVLSGCISAPRFLCIPVGRLDLAGRSGNASIPHAQQRCIGMLPIPGESDYGRPVSQGGRKPGLPRETG